MLLLTCKWFPPYGMSKIWLSNRKIRYYLILCNNHSHTDSLATFYFFPDRWVTKHGQEKILPGLNLNQKQLFWLSAANTWCSKYRPKALESLITLDTHSPGRYRVLGAYSNIPEFASDFQCKIGSKYNPLNKCTVWWNKQKTYL